MSTNILTIRLNKKDIKTKFFAILCFTMLFSCIFFTHNIKVKLLTLTIFISMGFLAFFSRKKKYRIITFQIAVIFPLVLFIINMLNSGNLTNAVKGAYCGIFFLSLPIIMFYNIPFEKVFEITMRIVVILVLGSILLDYIGIQDIFFNPLLIFMYENNELGIMTKSSQYPTYWKVYLQAESLLIIYSCFCFQRKKYLWLILSGMTMWFSGSMANPIAFFICIVGMWIDRILKTNFTKFFIFFGIILLILYSLIPFVLKSNDMIIRASILQVYLRLFKRPAVFFIGHGYMTDIYIPARNSYENATEWAFYEMIRWYGIIGFILFFVVLAKPIKKIIHTNRRWFVYGIISYLTIAFTNPLLYTTTGMIAYIMLYYEFFVTRNEKKSLIKNK